MARELDEYAGSGYAQQEDMAKTEPPVPQEIIRVLKIVEYLGERNVVEQTLRHGQGPHFATGRMIINTAILGTFPEVLDGSAAQAIRETLKAQQVYEKLVEEDNVVSEGKGLYLAQSQKALQQRQTVAAPPPPMPLPQWPQIISNSLKTTSKI